jgi:hypothetical protein
MKVYLVQVHDVESYEINSQSLFSNKKHAKIYAKILERTGDIICVSEFVLDEVDLISKEIEEYYDLISKV